jgi:SARP family transcriptional regulator, regulator of embCAB operon
MATVEDHQRADPPTDRIQLCGRLVAAVDGRRIDEGLARGEERLLFAYLVLQRLSPAEPQALIQAVWPDDSPQDAQGQIDALLRRVRRLVGRRLELQPYVQLRLNDDTLVDVEVAAEAVHRAEGAIARRDWSTSWPAARIALHTARRPFLPGARAPWVEAQRRRLRDIELRALECVAATGLGLGGNEVISAERSSRILIEREPLRESGYRYLLMALIRRGNAAEAIQTYTDFARKLEKEVGIGPSPELRAIRDQLTQGTVEPSTQASETAARAFMFTDICDSTALVTTIGDQAWRFLLEWHDRLVDQVVGEHHGEVLDRAGDGVFAAFSNTGDAARCAVTLQQRLAAHRVKHGFAPSLRIGVHADSAVPTRGKFTGRGVHLAARVAAVAGPGEIVLTSSTATAANVTLHRRQEVLLKGLAEAVEVGILRWD